MNDNNQNRGLGQWAYGTTTASVPKLTSSMGIQWASPFPQVTSDSKPKSLMKTVLDDIKAFIHEHKSIIYTVVLVFVLDHFFLNGRLKAKIQEIASRFLNTVEKKLDNINPEAK